MSEVSRQKQQEIEDQRALDQREIQIDRAQQSILQSYIHNIAELLLDKGLATSKPDSLIRQVAHADTASVIRQIDSGRNRILVGFLSNSNILSSGSVVLLRGADLSGVDLSRANLNDADLRDANLSGAINLVDEQLAQAESLVDATFDPKYKPINNLA